MNKFVLLFIIILAIVSYFLFSPVKISYSNPLVDGSKIISKSNCSHLFKCNNITDKILFEIIESSKITNNNTITIDYKVYESFNLTSQENKRLVNDVLKNINIDTDINNILIDNDKLVVNNNRNCSINGNLVIEPCENNSIKAYYNLISNIGNGESCINLFNRIENTLDSNYSNWTYDAQKFRFIGEKTCNSVNDINCAINGQLVNSECNNNKITGSYNLTPSSGKGESCSSFFNRIKNTLDSNYSNWIYDSQKSKFIGEKDCFTGTNCNITGEINILPCDVVNEKSKGFYNVISPTVTGRSCDDFVYNVLSTSQKKDYQNWKYDKETNKIVGEKNCCPNDKVYYNGNCINSDDCKTSLFSQSGKSCYDECPQGFYEDRQLGLCKPYVNAITQYDQLLKGINNNDLLCNKLIFSKTSDEVFKEYVNEKRECGEATKNERFVQLYCNSSGSCNKFYNIVNIRMQENVIYPEYVSNNGKDIFFSNIYTTTDYNRLFYYIKYNNSDYGTKYKINDTKKLIEWDNYTWMGIDFSSVDFINYKFINNNELLIVYDIVYFKLVSNNWVPFSKLCLIKYNINNNNIEVLNKTIYERVKNLSSNDFEKSLKNCNIYYKDSNSIYLIIYLNDGTVYIYKNNIDITNIINPQGKLLNVILPESSSYVHFLFINNQILYTKYSIDNGQTYNETSIYTYSDNSINQENILDSVSSTSSDGQHIFINCVDNYGSKEFFISHDYGFSYTSKQIITEYNILSNTNIIPHNIYNIKCSNDGKYVSVITSLNNYYITSGRTIIKIYISNDYGYTFNESSNIKLDYLKRFYWVGEKSFNISNDGKYQVYSFYDDEDNTAFFYSSNYGQTWIIKDFNLKDITNIKEDDFYNKFQNIDVLT